MSAPPTLTPYPAVILDDASLTAGAFVVIGVSRRHHEPGALPTRIGRRATTRSHTVIHAGTVIGDQGRSVSREETE